MRWTILIPTLGSRSEQFMSLLGDILFPQVNDHLDVEIVAFFNQGERPLTTIRQLLLLEAWGDYVSFVDDDDTLPGYFVGEVLRMLASGPDYVGWRMQTYISGNPLKPTFHSLRYDGWSEDDNGFYRDISHLNPIKRSIALQGDFRRAPEFGEDSSWATQIRGAANPPRSEMFIPDVMYHYRYSSLGTSFPGQRRRVPGGTYTRPDIRHHSFRWHPMSATRLVR